MKQHQLYSGAKAGAKIKPLVLKCNKCAKPTLWELQELHDVGSEHVVVKCLKCNLTGVRERKDIVDKAVERCKLCGGWKMDYQKCYTCKK